MTRALPRLGHVAALDGIRGIAVGIVVLHHLKLPGIHGGWLGVDLFFALSGFLITQSVLSKPDRLGEFWRRRAWRLAPAMAVLLGAYALWWWLFDVEAADGDLRARWLGAAAGQFLNVHDAWSTDGPFSDYLGHLWSLSAEVQFYVVWPIVLTLLLALRLPRVAVVLAPLALLVVTSVERTVMANEGVQWNRLYLGPDTRSSALWAGCVIGLLHAWGWLRPLRIPLAALAVPALVALGWLVAHEPMVFVGRVPFEWGLTVIAVCALVLVVAEPEFPPLRVTQGYVDRLEDWCDEYNEPLEKLRSFILPGGTPGAALLHVACTTTRRAERSAWAAYGEYGDTMNVLAVKYLNRLSDLLFILARHANLERGDVLWRPGGDHAG